MSKNDYLPEAGDIVVIDFDPQVGKEITKRRPALVLSGKNFNSARGLAFVAPITSQLRDSKMRVEVELEKPSQIVPERTKSVDFRGRRAKKIDESTEEQLASARHILGAICEVPKD